MFQAKLRLCLSLELTQRKVLTLWGCLSDSRAREGLDLVEIQHPHSNKAVIAGAGHQLAILLIQAHVSHLQNIARTEDWPELIKLAALLEKGMLSVWLPLLCSKLVTSMPGVSQIRLSGRLSEGTSTSLLVLHAARCGFDQCVHA